MSRSTSIRWARVMACALCGLAASGQARPQPRPGLLVALPGGIMPGENAEVRRATDVYLYDFGPVVEEIGPLPGGMSAQISRAVEVARARDLRLVIVLFWTAATELRELTTHFADLRSPEAKPVSFTIPWPHQPDEAFYRLLGLKLRSTLLAMVGAPGKPGGAGDEARDQAGRGERDGPIGFGLEATCATDVPLDVVAVIPAFGGGLRWAGARWTLGLLAARSLAVTRTTAAARGETATTRMVGAVGYRLAQAADRWSLFGEIQAGGLLLDSRARILATGEERDHGEFLPVGSAAIMLSYDIGRHVRVLLGGHLDVLFVRGWYTVEGAEVYNSGRLRPGMDLRVQAFF